MKFESAGVVIALSTLCRSEAAVAVVTNSGISGEMLGGDTCSDLTICLSLSSDLFLHNLLCLVLSDPGNINILKLIHVFKTNALVLSSM